MHKAVLLDLGKTVIDFDLGRAYRKLAPFCPLSGAEIARRVAASGLAGRFVTGRIDGLELFRGLRERLLLELEFQPFVEIWNCIFTETLIPEEALEGLASRYPLVLVSNTNALHFEWLRREKPFLRHFSHLILSHEAGAAKPDPAIFRLAIERAGCLPGECFYTDDIPPFVEAARDLGMDATQFTGWDGLRNDFARRGIGWRKPSR